MVASNFILVLKKPAMFQMDGQHEFRLRSPATYSPNPKETKERERNKTAGFLLSPTKPVYGALFKGTRSRTSKGMWKRAGSSGKVHVSPPLRSIEPRGEWPDSRFQREPWKEVTSPPVRIQPKKNPFGLYALHGP